MARLNHPRTAPPDGFIYTQPETGGRWEAGTLEALVDIVLAHRQYRNLERADRDSTRLDIERQICSGMPPGTCRGEPGEDYEPFVDRARDISLETLMEFSGVCLRYIGSGGELVSKEESTRRANICRGCRFNRPSPCAVCTPAFKAIAALIPGNRIESGLWACGICGCSLPAKTLLPLSTIRKADADKNLRFPSYCWLNDNEAP